MVADAENSDGRALLFGRIVVRVGKIVLGLATLWPVVWILVFAVVGVVDKFSWLPQRNPAGAQALSAKSVGFTLYAAMYLWWLNSLFVPVLAFIEPAVLRPANGKEAFLLFTIIDVWILVVVYVLHVWRDRRLSKLAKVAWTGVMVGGHALTAPLMLVYWLRHVKGTSNAPMRASHPEGLS